MADDKKYYYCDYPVSINGNEYLANIFDTVVACGKPVPDQHSGKPLKRCQAHRDRLPYWPQDEGGEG